MEGGFDGIVVVDEAYVDFSGKTSACSLIDELDRVVVLQTLSKAFGMAAIRCVRACVRSTVVADACASPSRGGECRTDAPTTPTPRAIEKVASPGFAALCEYFGAPAVGLSSPPARVALC